MHHDVPLRQELLIATLPEDGLPLERTTISFKKTSTMRSILDIQFIYVSREASRRCLLCVAATVINYSCQEALRASLWTDDHFMPQLAQQTADPGRMRPDFQCDPAVRHLAEDFAQCFCTRTYSLFPLNLAGFIHTAVLAVSIS